jgi:glucuronate isomerase
MDRQRLLAEIATAQAKPDNVLYLERQGEDYSWRFLDAGDVREATAQGGEPGPDAWMVYSGPWPTHERDDLPEFLDELLAEMESMCGGADRCRWPLDQPYPLRH